MEQVVVTVCEHSFFWDFIVPILTPALAAILTVYPIIWIKRALSKKRDPPSERKDIIEVNVIYDGRRKNSPLLKWASNRYVGRNGWFLRFLISIARWLAPHHDPPKKSKPNV